MPQLTERCELWRLTTNTESGKKQMTAILTAIPCLRVPISTFDKVAAPLSAPDTASIPAEYMHSQARQSTDVFLLPDWVAVRPDDEIRRGRRTNNVGQVVAHIYNVDGIRDYETFGYQNTVAVFATLST